MWKTMATLVAIVFHIASSKKISSPPALPKETPSHNNKFLHPPLKTIDVHSAGEREELGGRGFPI